MAPPGDQMLIIVFTIVLLHVHLFALPVDTGLLQIIIQYTLHRALCLHQYASLHVADVMSQNNATNIEVSYQQYKTTFDLDRRR